ncbi:MAG TPA: class I SAM-dependent methyltransferase [Baekduia sp.]
MDLHPLAHGFADVADAYERGRPGYTPEAVAAIGLAPGARVADVGAGTGKLTRALRDAGFDVVAVEPFAAMRAAIAPELPDVEVLEGAAEALPLGDASVDGVACGDSFHWFDGARAAPELARVIRPGGVLAILGNTAAGEAARAGAAWGQPLIDLLNAVRPEHPAFTEDQGRAAIDATGRFEPFAQASVTQLHETSRAGMVASIASMSYIALLPDAQRSDLLGRADALLREHGVEDVGVPLRTTIWTARRRAA